MKTRFQEKVNPNICDKLTTLSFTTFKDIVSSYNGDVGADDLKSQYYSLKKYCKEQSASNHEVSRVYGYARQRQSGRLFVKPYGLQFINSLFRGVLCDGLYTDYDMINAHPVLLKYILATKGITSYQLNDYVEHRENRLEGLMNDIDCERWEAKLIYIGSINSAYIKTKYKKKNIKDQAFKEFDKEMKRLQGILEKEFPKDYQDVKDFYSSVGKEYHSGHMANWLMANLEAEILNQVQDAYGSAKDVLMYDGFMSGSCVKIEIEDLNNLTNKYGIKWSIKPHDKSILDMIEKDEGEFSAVGANLVELGDALLEEPLKGKLLYCNGRLYFKEENKWSVDKEECFRTLRNFIMNCDLYMEGNGKEEYINVSKVPQHIINLSKIILNDRCPKDNQFVDKVWDNTIGKLCFENGWYDFTTNTFHNGYTDMDTFIIAPHKLSMKSNPEARERIYHKLLNPIFTLDPDREDFEERTQMLECILHRIARSMAGYVVDKRWLIFTSGRNSGKGVIAGALENAFGNEYVKTTNTNTFKYKDSSGDSALANKFMADFQFSRLMIGSEASVSANGKRSPIDGVKIKMVCSGGDYLECRRLYENDARIRLQSGLLFFANDFPKIEPDDAADPEFCLKFDMKSKFVEPKDLHKQKHITKFFPKDNTIKQVFLKDPEILNEFILLIFEAFNKPVEPPQALLDETECLEEESDEDKLCDMFELSAGSFIDYTHLKTLLALHNIDSMTQHKATKILTDHFGIKRANWGCKVGGHRGIKGIRHKVKESIDTYEEED